MKCLSLAAFLICMSLPSIGVAEQKISGNYEGVIFSTGRDYPGQTRISVSEDGEISGEYVFKGHFGPELGTLSSCEFSDMKLYCIWKDNYGEGDWRVTFSDDFRSFEGKWFSKTDVDPEVDLGFRWDGSKDAVGTSFSEGV